MDGLEDCRAQWNGMAFDCLKEATTLSIVVPCFNEEETIQKCVKRILSVAEKNLKLEIIIVDDASTDGSLEIARSFEVYPEVRVLAHDFNQGKGAALRTGFQFASGDYVAVQDADLEYDPNELKKLLIPLIQGHADVVYGSRFLSVNPHRVLYFWHYMGNRFLTFFSNMFTDLNLTDMETCYKVFRTDIIKKVKIEEDRFGFEPEITAKIARMKLKIYEMGISYYGRTYEEGKKIGIRDGVRALYCIFRYNFSHAPLPIQIFMYLFIGGFSAVLNLISFLIMDLAGIGLNFAVPFSYILASAVNYSLCLFLLFRNRSKWSKLNQVIIFLVVLFLGCLGDYYITKSLIFMDFGKALSKLISSMVLFLPNFIGKKILFF
ncbi:MAG: glycosyltransferase [Desulfococcaceae bacterium]